MPLVVLPTGTAPGPKYVVAVKLTVVLLVPLSVVLVRVRVSVETVPVEVEVLVTGPGVMGQREETDHTIPLKNG